MRSLNSPRDLVSCAKHMARVNINGVPLGKHEREITPNVCLILFDNQ